MNDKIKKTKNKNIADFSLVKESKKPKKKKLKKVEFYILLTLRGHPSGRCGSN